jgi:hypothetical protein
MAIGTCPCYGCEEKFIGCHGEQCPKKPGYLEWLEEKRNLNKVMANHDREIREYKVKRNDKFHSV